MHTKHRHFLAAPLFVLALGMTVMTAQSPVRAQVIPEVIPMGRITATGGDRQFSLSRGISGQLREDGIVTDDGKDLLLEDGALLVTSDDMATVRAGDVFLSAFHGGFLATHNGPKFSVLALTSPVLVARGEFRMIVPQGMQASWTTPSELPVVFDQGAIVSERLAMQVIPDAVRSSSLQELSTIPPAPLPRPEGILLDTLAQTLRSGHPKAALNLLRDAPVQEFLSSMSLSQDVLRGLIADAAEIPSAQENLIRSLHDPDLWLLLSFHPEFQAAAWETSGPLTISAEDRMLRWLLLLSSDIDDAVPSRAAEQWTDQMERALRGLDAPEPFLEALLRSLGGHKAFLDQSGYPERLERTAGALRAVVGPYQGKLSDEAVAIYRDWAESDAVVPYVEPPEPVAIPEEASQSSSAEPATEETVEPFDAALVESAAKELLLGVGALFTTQTSLMAEAGDRVLVRELLYAGADGEHRYDFTFDPVEQHVMNLKRDGELLPYPLNLDAFAQWAAGQNHER